MVRFLILLVLLLILRLLLFYAYPSQNQALRIESMDKGAAFGIKQKVLKTYKSVLSPSQADLLSGIVFGGEVKKEAKEKFISTGVLHVVAASGMNVSMLTSFLLGTLIIFLRRQYAIIITSAIIILYAAMADFQPSIIRASIMALFALGAGLTGRQNTSLLALLLTAFIMVSFDPAILVSVSFILSFTATLGIILLDPLLKKGIFSHGFFEDFRTTISAQIATTPILLFLFGAYSPISILANFLVLWTIPPLMALGMLAAVLAFVSNALVLIPLYLAFPLLSYFEAVVDFFASKAVVLELQAVPWAIVAGYYLILLAGILWMNKFKFETGKA